MHSHIDLFHVHMLLASCIHPCFVHTKTKNESSKMKKVLSSKTTTEIVWLRFNHIWRCICLLSYSFFLFLQVEIHPCSPHLDFVFLVFFLCIYNISLPTRLWNRWNIAKRIVIYVYIFFLLSYSPYYAVQIFTNNGKKASKLFSNANMIMTKYFLSLFTLWFFLFFFVWNAVNFSFFDAY